MIDSTSSLSSWKSRSRIKNDNLLNLPTLLVGMQSGTLHWSHYGEEHGGSLENEKIELPYDPAILLLGIHPEDMVQKDNATQCSMQHCLY